MNERDKYLFDRIDACGDWNEAEPYMRELMYRCGLDYDDDAGNKKAMNCPDYKYDNDEIYYHCIKYIEKEDRQEKEAREMLNDVRRLRKMIDGMSEEKSDSEIKKFCKKYGVKEETATSLINETIYFDGVTM